MERNISGRTGSGKSEIALGSRSLDQAHAQQMEECIRLCLECTKICEQCAMDCARMEWGGMSTCIELCLDCADISLLSARYMARRSGFHTRACAVCAEVCDACAVECENLADSDDPAMARLMEECMDACRRCADACRAMAHTDHRNNNMARA